MQPAAERFWTVLEQHSGIALGEGPRQVSYAELRHEVAARASQLQQLGVQRVALALDNGLATANGRLRRNALFNHYQSAINAIQP